MSSVTGDPLDWTVEDVVDFLCHRSQTPWSQSATKSPRPDLATLEVSLRDNMITGEVLLNDVDKDALRNDLGLKALGHRSSMLIAIRYLQQNSPKFQNSLVNHNLHFGDRHGFSATPRSPDERYSPYGNLLSGATSPQQGTAHGSGFIPTSVSALQNSKGINSAAPSSSSHPRISREYSAPEPSNPNKELTDDLDESDGSASMELSNSPPVEQPVASNPGTKIRSGERYIVDSKGKKRRKLELGHTHDIQPTNPISKTTSFSADKVWYMGANAITPDELFYPLDTDDEGESFVIASPRFPTAQSSFVNKRLNYFYRQQPVKLNSQNGRSQWALIPYKPSKGHADRQRYFTLYTPKNEQVIVSKESVNKWPQLNEMQGVGLEASTSASEPFDMFAFLAQKYQAQDGSDDVLPFYGDSGSEGEYDEETWEEIDNERQEPVQSQAPRLTSAEVDSIISNSIAEYERKWHQDHLPQEEPKARSLWLWAKKGKCRNQKIQTFQIDIDLLEHRLGKLQDGIRKSDYATRSELETQCQSLEQTVFRAQSQKWRVSVLEQEACPPKIAVAPKPRPKPKQRNAGDDESLHSESDGFIDDISSDESPVDFVDDAEEPAEQGQTQLDKTRNTPSPSSDDEVIIPSGARRRSKARKGPKVAARIKKATPHTVHANQRSRGYIDLTRDSKSPAPDGNATATRATNSSEPDGKTTTPQGSSSPALEDLTIETPPLNPVEPKIQESRDLPDKTERKPSVSPMPGIGTDEFVAVCVPTRRRNAHNPNDFDDLSAVRWDTIEERKNRRLLLAKLIHCLSGGERDNLASSVLDYDVNRLKLEVTKGLKAIRANSEKIEGKDESENHLIMRITSFFIAWVNCSRLSIKGIPRSQVQSALEDLHGFSAFFNELCLRLKVSAHETSEKKTSRGSIMRSDPNTPHKERKREVKESQDAKKYQETAQKRAAHQDSQRKALEQKMKLMGVSNDDPTRQAISFGNPVIYLDPHIGQRVKPHQLQGIQFMWRELIADEKPQGCLLAHTMGLGKTMQVISLLNTLSAAACSDDGKIFHQIPEQLRRSQTLVLCPSALVENWYEEFLMWTPPANDLGPIRKITSGPSLGERLQEAFDWDQDGGILILSYDTFRIWINNNETKAKKRPLGEDDHRSIKECLLNGPNIIVADEAHKMKNSTSGITMAAKQFRSRSRIALTGSPLANNLVEYFTMVDWIAPGYLGEFVGFKANYVEPIEDGLYSESTAQERRKSLIKLQVLKEILEPKISRADINVLERSLPSKVEFVITFPLTEVQKAAYNSYVESLCSGNGDYTNTKLWSWLAILALCCNHPACFRDKLLSRANDAAKAAKEDFEVLPGDESVAQAGLPEELIPEQEKLFATISDMKALDLSYRTQLLDRIVTLSIEAGDKILVFSHSIPTLNYLEHVLQSSGHRYCRLDGRTPVHGRQAATKKFNTGSEHQVYLISTRAGGLGLNIPGANRVVIFDLNWNPVWEEQAVGRVYRIGQKKQVYVYRFLAGGTFEEVMYNKAVFKTQLAFRVVDKKNPIRRASRSTKEYLFPVKPVKQKGFSEHIGKDPLVLDQILENDQGSIRRIALTETFQKEGDDKLTDEDRKDVQTQLSDERLRRSDPAAYEKLMQERQAQLMNANRILMQSSDPAMHQFTAQYQFPASSVPPSAHNVGPPPLPPDTSVTPSLKPLNQIPLLPSMSSSMPRPFSVPTSPLPHGHGQGKARSGSLQPNRPARNSGNHTNSEARIQNDSSADTQQPPESTLFDRFADSLQSNRNGRVCPQQ